MPYIPLTQYLYPDGRMRTVEAPVSDETFACYKKLQPILSCEVLQDGLIVAIYGRLPGDPDEKELIRLASNGPENGPTENLEKLLKELETSKEQQT